jgi:hypothetical protein
MNGSAPTSNGFAFVEVKKVDYAPTHEKFCSWKPKGSIKNNKKNKSMNVSFVKKLITAGTLLPGLAIGAIGMLGFFAAQTLVAHAESLGPITFEPETYIVGNIDGQDSWIKTGPYDAAVTATGIPAGFGTQSLRISDAVTSGSFGDQTFTKPLTDSAGETIATAGTFSVGTKQPHFEMQFDIASTMPTVQTGMHVSVSPDRGDGSRMSYLRFDDMADGIHVFFDDVTDPGPLGTVATFNETDIGTISRSPHTIKLTMDTVDGPANDVVKVYIDGVLAHTGTSWEDYYRYDPEASAEQSPRIVKTVLFRESGTANADDAGKGFLFDNLSLSSGPITFPTYEGEGAVCPQGTQPDPESVITKVISATNPVGESFSLSPNANGYLFEASGTFVPTSAPNYFSDAGYTTSDNWTTLATQYGINGVPPDKGAHALLADLGSGVGILDWGAYSSSHDYSKYFDIATSSAQPVQFVIGDRYDSWYNTPYQNQTGMSDNSGSLALNVFACKASPTSAKVTIVKYLDGVPATAENANSTAFPMHAVYPGGEGDYALSTVGFNNPNPYQATTADMPIGSNYGTSENLGVVVGASCEASGAPYALQGYTTGDTLQQAGATPATSTAPVSFTNLTSDKFVVVWNAKCTPPPLLKVHILKYLDGAQATAITANNYQFPMTATWQTANLNGGATTTGTYVLGNNHGGAPDLYGADTSPMQAPADYTTSEITDNTSNVLPSDASCVAGKYRLDSYQVSTSSFADALTQATSTNAPNFTGLTSDRYVVVRNITCPTTASLTVEKRTIGGNGTFTLSGDNGIGSFQITTTGNTSQGGSGSTTFNNLTPGTYNITETAKTGWTQTENSCSQLVLAAGENALCVVINTNNKKLGSIRGIKYEDKDGDGTLKDGDHHRLAGWTIYLDTNNNGTPDLGEPTTVTDNHGLYFFPGLVAGTYHVREVGQAGWTQTYPASGKYDVTLATGQNAKNKNFGNFKLGSISGMKFNDANGNRRKDGGEIGLQGWTINLTKIGSPTIIVTSTITDASGTYSFANLGPGTYRVREVQQNGWVQTTSNPPNIKIRSGTVSTKDNFGNHYGPVTKDKDHDGYGNFGNNGFPSFVNR